MARSATLACLILALLAPAAGAQRAWAPAASVAANAEQAAAGVTGNEIVTAWSEPGSGAIVLKAQVTPAGAAVTLDDRMSYVVDVAGAGDGSAVVAWLDYPEDGTLPRTLAAVRPPGGSFGPPADLGQSGWARQIGTAGNARGDLVVAFIREVDYSPHLYAAFRPAGGPFGEPVPIATDGAVVHHDVSLSESGEAAFSWTYERSGPAYEVHAASLPAGGAPTSAAKLSGDADAGLSAVAVDGDGRLLAAWNERSGGIAGGPLRAAVRTPAGEWSAATGLDGSTHSAPDVATGVNGDAVIAWAGYTSLGPNGGQLTPVRVAAGRTDSGAFAPPREFGTSDSSPSLASRPDGSVLLAYGDTTGEAHAARRDGAGAFGPAQTVMCPTPRGRAEAAGFTASGSAAVLVHRGMNVDLGRPLWLTADLPSATAGPAACAPVPRRPFVVFDPAFVTAGRPVTIDVEGSRDADFDPTTWRWDMDDDGVYEVDTGAVPVHTHTWATTGSKRWNLQVANRAYTGGYNMLTAVMPPGSTSPAPLVLGAVEVPRGQRVRTVLRHGLRATALSTQAGPVQVELWAGRGEARRLRLARGAKRLGGVTVALESNREGAAVLRVSRSAARRLAKVRRTRLRLRLTRGGKPLASAPLSLRR